MLAGNHIKFYKSCIDCAAGTIGFGGFSGFSFWGSWCPWQNILYNAPCL